VLDWIKNLIHKKSAVEAVVETTDEVEENFAPVGVRVRPPAPVPPKPADTHIAGYNVHEAGVTTDDEFSTTVNNIKTTGIDPYNTGHIDQLDAEDTDSEK